MVKASRRSPDIWKFLGAIGLGVAGNAVYDAFKGEWGIAPVVLYVLLSVLASLLSLLLLRSVSGYEKLRSQERPFISESKWRFLNTVAGAAAAAAVLGPVVALAWVLPLLYVDTVDPLPFVPFTPAVRPYEVGLMATYTLVCVLFTRRQTDWVCLLAFAAVFATTATAMVCSLDEENAFSVTISSYFWICLLLMVGALLVHSAGVRKALFELTRQR